MKGSEMDDSTRRMTADLQALGRSSLSNLPTIHQTARALEGNPARLAREGLMTMTMRTLRVKPWLTATLAVVGMAAILLVVPISYTRTTGYDVRLTLPSGPGTLSEEKVAEQFKQCLGADQVWVPRMAGGSMMTARVRPVARSRIETAARTFTKVLNERGIPATTSVTPVTEQVSTNLVAWAAEQAVTIRVNRDGKTDEQVAAEIQEQLKAAGFNDPTVSVNTQDGRTEIKILEKCNPGDPVSCPATNLVVDGKDMSDGSHAAIRIKIDHPMTDAEIKAEAERQLREQGVEATVEVHNGEINIIDPKK